MGVVYENQREKRAKLVDRNLCDADEIWGLRAMDVKSKDLIDAIERVEMRIKRRQDKVFGGRKM